MLRASQTMTTPWQKNAVSLRRGSEDILGSLPIKHLKQGENPPTPAFMRSTAMILATFSVQHEKKAVKQRRSYNLNIFT